VVGHNREIKVLRELVVSITGNLDALLKSRQWPEEANS
jgi:hypothetical protein